MKKKRNLKQELIESIQNEKRSFNMDHWSTVQTKRVELPGLTTCRTASCMAGHIVALRRTRAKELMKESPFTYGLPGYGPSYRYPRKPCFEALARRIWQEEMGESCPLDFFAMRFPASRAKITRRQAIAHIRGTSKIWPQVKLS